jgi:hypothetical protein
MTLSGWLIVLRIWKAGAYPMTHDRKQVQVVMGTKMMPSRTRVHVDLSITQAISRLTWQVNNN